MSSTKNTAPQYQDPWQSTVGESWSAKIEGNVTLMVISINIAQLLLFLYTSIIIIIIEAFRPSSSSLRAVRLFKKASIRFLSLKPRVSSRKLQFVFLGFRFIFRNLRPILLIKRLQRLQIKFTSSRRNNVKPIRDHPEPNDLQRQPLPLPPSSDQYLLRNPCLPRPHSPHRHQPHHCFLP
jgi:hypothetical protein